MVLERSLIRVDQEGLHSLGTFYVKNFEGDSKDITFSLHCLNDSCTDSCPQERTRLCIKNGTVKVRTTPSTEVTPYDRAQGYLDVKLTEDAGDHRYQFNITTLENGSVYASKTQTLVINEGQSYDEPTSLHGFKYIALAAGVFSLSAIVFALISVIRTR